MLRDVCIFGTGAVGGHVAARLAAGGRCRVSVVARGPMLRAVRERGLVLRSAGTELRARADAATDDPATLPPQDLVVVALKAHSVPAAAASIGRLLSPGGRALFLLNGIPWWWPWGADAHPAPLPLLDPDGTIADAIDPRCVLGGVVYSPNEVVEPGVVAHTGPNALVLGAPDGDGGEPARAAASLLEAAGFEVRIEDDLRREILLKLVYNASGGLLSALARADLGEVGTDPGLRALSIAVMRETGAVAAALGRDVARGLDLERIASRGRPGMRPSMLQDVLAGRPTEVEAIAGQLQAFAHRLAVPVPTLDVLVPLLRGLDRAIRAGTA